MPEELGGRPEKLYRKVNLFTFRGLRFMHVPDGNTIDLVVREILGSKRYREISLGVLGSRSDDNIYDLTCEDQLVLSEGIVLGVYYDGQQVGCGERDGPRVKVYVAYPTDYLGSVADYRTSVRNPGIVVQPEVLSQNSKFDLSKSWFILRGRPVP